MAELLDYLRSRWVIGKPLLYTALAFVLFLMFLVADFPYGDAISSLLAPSGLSLDYQDQHLNLPFGARFDEVRLRYADSSASGSTLIESPSVTVSPTIGSLLFRRPGLRIAAKLRDGAKPGVGAKPGDGAKPGEGWIRVTLSESGGATDVSFTANEVALASYEPLGQFAQGNLSGDGSIEIDSANALAGKGAVELSGKRLAVRLGPAMPPIELDDAAATLKMDQGVVEVAKLEGHGPDFSISAHGTIQLAPILLQSIADLTVTLEPTPSGRKHFGVLLNLLPHPPGSGPYFVRGPLALPSIK